MNKKFECICGTCAKPEVWPLSKKLAVEALDQLRDEKEKLSSFISPDMFNQRLVELVLNEINHLIILKTRAGDDSNSQWNKALSAIKTSMREIF